VSLRLGEIEPGGQELPASEWSKSPRQMFFQKPGTKASHSVYLPQRLRRQPGPWKKPIVPKLMARSRHLIYYWRCDRDTGRRDQDKLQPCWERKAGNHCLPSLKAHLPTPLPQGQMGSDQKLHLMKALP
jgi:hypothetical protein